MHYAETRFDSALYAHRLLAFLDEVESARPLIARVDAATSELLDAPPAAVKEMAGVVAERLADTVNAGRARS
jgi:hypothetical protein